MWVSELWRFSRSISNLIQEYFRYHRRTRLPITLQAAETPSEGGGVAPIQLRNHTWIVSAAYLLDYQPTIDEVQIHALWPVVKKEKFQEMHIDFTDCLSYKPIIFSVNFFSTVNDKENFVTGEKNCWIRVQDWKWTIVNASVSNVCSEFSPNFADYYEDNKFNDPRIRTFVSKVQSNLSGFKPPKRYSGIQGRLDPID